ncbi:PREDICTED: uncharacterized protein LOC104812642 [Tarenaya hassleriana]|uniref:uncharacterized protein LOC104812642 n=1 Tax=Tarenaya hassleriana TaxID=28532 RepID=UPI00053C8CD0|nr:PREDICTED: uncharacterized protein LOC104812642 [Tarenaya hassleriana]
MAARQQKNRAKQRKLHFPTNLTDFKLSQGGQRAVIREALVYISLLKLKIEAAQKEYTHLKMVKREALNRINTKNQSEEVKVEKIGERFLVKVMCPRGQHMLVHILEAFEEMEMSVIQARVSCQNSFSMEAIVVVPQDLQAKVLSVDDMTQTLMKALAKPSG